MSTAYDFVQNLAQLAPVLTATPGSNGTEYTRPGGWQRCTQEGNTERIADWQPGHALMGVMGEAVAVLDVDPRNGGDAERVRQLLDALDVRIFAEVTTPGGGWHLYVAGHPDLATCHKLTGFPGVDVQSHGANVFLPGTARPKYDGAGYDVVLDDLPVLADGGDPLGAEALAGWVAENRVSKAETFDVAEPWTGSAPDQRQAAYLAAIVRNLFKRISVMGPDSGRNVKLYEAGLCCGNYIAGAGMDEAEAINVLLEAGAACGLVTDDGERAVLASIRSGIRNGRNSPRAVPAAQPDALTLTPVPTTEPETPTNRMRLTAAASIRPRPVFWLWKNRLAIGTIGLLAGREGLGKSTLGYWLAARITRGDLFGQFYGHPKSVLVCATEDSWEHTIVPRLMAADADLASVYRIEVVNADEIHIGLALPRDISATMRAAEQKDAALLLLDPLMSRLGDLDTHRDSEVRQALEPLAALADRAKLAILGLIHHNKSGSSDALQLVMGSKAFTAVARSVSTVIPDPDDESGQRRLFGTPKNNLGTTDLPTMSFHIGSHPIETDEGTAWTGQLIWGDEQADSIDEALRRSTDDPDARSATAEASDWLTDYLSSQGGTAPSSDIKHEGQKAGHSHDALKRARRGIKATLESSGFPRRTFWSLPGSQSEQQSEQTPRGDTPTALTAPTEAQATQSEQSEQSEHSEHVSNGSAPTGTPMEETA